MTTTLAFNSLTHKWPSRPSTVGATTPIVWVGPVTAGRPPALGSNDLRVISGDHVVTPPVPPVPIPIPIPPTPTPIDHSGGY